MPAQPSSPRPARPYLRLVVEPAVDGQSAWYARAERDLRLFLLRQGHMLSDPSLAHWVVEQCAELAWEWRDGPPTWAALRIDDLWARLGNLHRFFPQPRLVVAYYDTLQVFLPWLVAEGRLARPVALALLDRLELRRSPMLEQAREQLVARYRHRQR